MENVEVHDMESEAQSLATRLQAIEKERGQDGVDAVKDALALAILTENCVKAGRRTDETGAGNLDQINLQAAVKALVDFKAQVEMKKVGSVINGTPYALTMNDPGIAVTDIYQRHNAVAFTERVMEIMAASAPARTPPPGPSERPYGGS